MRRALAIIVAILVSIIWLSIPVAAATAWLGFWEPQQYIPEEFQTLPELAGIDLGQLSGLLDGRLGFQEPDLDGEPDVILVETATATDTPESLTPTAASPTATPEESPATPTPEPEDEIDITETLTETGEITSTVDLTSTLDLTSTVDISPTETVTSPVQSVVLAPATVASIGNLRAGPGTDFDIVGTVDEGATVLIVAQDPTGAWFRLTDGTWIASDLLVEPPSLPVAESTPLAGEATTPTAGETPTPAETPGLAQTQSVTVTVNADANLRAGPGTTFDVVGGANLGDVITIVGQNEAGDWYLIDTGNWVFSTLVTDEIPEGIPVVDEQGTILTGPNAGQSVIAAPPSETPASSTATPVATTEATPAAAAQAVSNADANLRAGPGTTFDVVGSAPAGTQLTIVGRNSAGDWYQLADDSWIFAALVNNAPANLPVVETP
jgi:uncharacterized protein YgiM (DUF1202 family)